MFKPKEAAKVKGRESLGWVGIVRNGPVNSRVSILAADDEVGQDTFLVANRNFYERRLLYKNMRRRVWDHPQGKVYHRTAAIKGQDSKERYFIVQDGGIESRLVAVGPDGKSTGESFAFPNMHIEDRQVWHEPVERITVMDERGVLVVPVATRRALGIMGRDSIEVEQRDGGIFIRPLGPIEDMHDGEKLS